MSDHHTAPGAEHGEAARHRFVIGKTTIAVQFNPICKTPFDIIESKRPLHMARDLDALPGSQITVELTPGFAKLALNCLNRGIQIDVMLVGVVL